MNPALRLQTITDPTPGRINYEIAQQKKLKAKEIAKFVAAIVLPIIFFTLASLLLAFLPPLVPSLVAGASVVATFGIQCGVGIAIAFSFIFGIISFCQPLKSRVYRDSLSNIKQINQNIEQLRNM